MFFWDTKPEPRYKRRIYGIEHIVCHDAKISKEKLEEILKVLDKHGVID